MICKGFLDGLEMVLDGFEMIFRWFLLCLGLVTSRSLYIRSVFKVISDRIRIESVVQVVFDV